MTTNGDPAAPATGTETDTNALAEAVAETVDKAEYDKAVAHSRKWEERAKANAKASEELEKLRKQAMTDQEKAIAEAVAQARTDALSEVGSKLVAAEIRAVAAGRSVDTDALIDGINTARFLGESGEPDREAITEWLDKVAPKPTEQTAPTVADIGQGTRGQPPALNSSQLERDVKSLLGVS